MTLEAISVTLKIHLLRQFVKQVSIAIDQAEIILLMVDVATGITDLDEQVADMSTAQEKVLLVVNKVDNHDRQLDAHEFWTLGFETMHPVSSVTGSGTGDLLDSVVELLPEVEEVEDDRPKIAIIGVLMLVNPHLLMPY